MLGAALSAVGQAAPSYPGDVTSEEVDKAIGQVMTFVEQVRRLSGQKPIAKYCVCTTMNIYLSKLFIKERKPVMKRLRTRYINLQSNLAQDN